MYFFFRILNQKFVLTWSGFCFLYLRSTRSPHASSVSQSAGGRPIRSSGLFSNIKIRERSFNTGLGTQQETKKWRPLIFKVLSVPNDTTGGYYVTAVVKFGFNTSNFFPPIFFCPCVVNNDITDFGFLIFSTNAVVTMTRDYPRFFDTP